MGMSLEWKQQHRLEMFLAEYQRETTRLARELDKRRLIQKAWRAMMKKATGKEPAPEIRDPVAASVAKYLKLDEDEARELLEATS
jgi:hypothetical protein